MDRDATALPCLMVLLLERGLPIEFAVDDDGDGDGLGGGGEATSNSHSISAFSNLLVQLPQTGRISSH